VCVCVWMCVCVCISNVDRCEENSTEMIELLCTNEA